MTDYLKLLQETTILCPVCRGDSTVHEPASCERCRGSGQVPLVPGLTRPCPGHPKRVYEAGHFAGYKKISCAEAGCSGVVPVSEAEAVVALLTFALHRDRDRVQPVVSFQLEGDGSITAYVEDRGGNDVDGSGYTFAEALAEALYKAIEVKAE